MESESKFCCKSDFQKKRYLLAVMVCFGLLIPLGMRCEIGIAIIKMTELRQKMVPLDITNTSKMHAIMVREVAWSNTKVSLIEASFYIGYTLFSVPGGFMSTVFSANKVLGVAVLTSGIINIIIPVFVHLQYGFVLVFFFRVLQGMAEGCLYPSVHGFWRYWAPRQERSKLVTISFFGMSVGPIVGYPVSGILTKHFDWPSNFYVWGFLSGFWAIAWLIISRKCPTDDSCLSDNERTYIEKNTSQVSTVTTRVPWVAIMTSVPVWAIIVANVGRNWTYQFSFSGLPTFFSQKFMARSVDLGFHMSIPYIIMALLTPASGITADCMIKRGYSVGFVRKLFNTVGFGIAGLCFLLLGHVPYLWMATTVLSIGLGSFGIGISGFGVNHLDVADIYAAVLMGISNGLATLAGVLAPIVAMEITKRYSVTHGWIIFFSLSGTIHIVTVIFYAFFASGENQTWSVPDKLSQHHEEDKRPIPANDDLPHDQEEEKDTIPKSND